MDLTLATPALLFGAISLLILAYTNRFLAIAALIRNLHARYTGTGDRLAFQQIVHLRGRLRLIQAMQWFGALSFLLCLVTMLALFGGAVALSKALFVVSLAVLMLSLALSMREIQISGRALALQLADLEDDAPPRQPRADPTAPPMLP